jgi:sialate O-acetylesterase
MKDYLFNRATACGRLFDTSMKSIFSLMFLLLLLSGVDSRAEVRMCAIFGNHMVLQRDVEIPVWGTAMPGEHVIVSLGQDQATGIADANGKWKAKLPARAASAAPLDLAVTGTNKIVFHDVLIGDVWIAAGQSNMDWAFFWGDGVLNTKEEMAKADYPLIRDCKVGTTSSPEARDDMHASWIVCTPKKTGSAPFSSGIERFTATGYFFARELNQRLKIPIGLINSSYGGTQIEAWLDPDTAKQFPFIEERWQKRVAAYPDEQAKYAAAKAAWDGDKAAALASGQPYKKGALLPPAIPEKDIVRPSGLYNAMIHPFLGYAFKGVIWYQGENNAKRADEYQRLFPALIEGWRKQFGEGDFPFYWAQLSSYDFQSRPNGTEWAFLREAQTMTLSLPNTGQAVTLDIGDATNIHLRNKQEVGRRLALLALARTYEFKDVPDSGPLFDHADLRSSPVKVYFKNAGGGLRQIEPKDAASPSKPVDSPSALGGFELAGEDQIFHPAKAQIDQTRSYVLVSCSVVPQPIALRYAWRNDPKNLVLGNQAGLPAWPFRTDTWPEAETDSPPK